MCYLFILISLIFFSLFVNNCIFIWTKIEKVFKYLDTIIIISEYV